jgi:hypothetical protein
MIKEGLESLDLSELLPSFPWEGPPLPRKMGVKWEEIKIVKRYDFHDLVFYIGTGLAASAIFLLLARPKD